MLFRTCARRKRRWGTFSDWSELCCNLQAKRELPARAEMTTQRIRISATAFREQLDSLFLLALLLTGDELNAEKCFLTAFDICLHRSLVFKESAASWCRRSVIKTAIRLMLPVRFDPSRPHFPGNDSSLNLDQDASLKSLPSAAALRSLCICNVRAGGLLRSRVRASPGLLI